eukprot:6467177-Amphidinium_carterae.1
MYQLDLISPLVAALVTRLGSPSCVCQCPSCYEIVASLQEYHNHTELNVTVYLSLVFGVCSLSFLAGVVCGRTSLGCRWCARSKQESEVSLPSRKREQSIPARGILLASDRRLDKSPSSESVRVIKGEGASPAELRELGLLR